MTKRMKYKHWECEVYKGYYGNNSPALILKSIDNKDVVDGEVISVATVNLDEPLEENQAYIKDYSENAGMLSSLIKAGIVKNIIGEKQTGWVTIKLVELNLEGIEDVIN